MNPTQALEILDAIRKQASMCLKDHETAGAAVELLRGELQALEDFRKPPAAPTPAAEAKKK